MHYLLQKQNTMTRNSFKVGGPLHSLRLLPILLFLHLTSSFCPDWPWPSAQEQVLAGFAGQTGVGRQTTQYSLGTDRNRVGDGWGEGKGVKKEAEGWFRRWRDSLKES